MKVTEKLLTENDACEDQITLFCDTFPEGIEPTLELCRKHAQDFDFGWAAHTLLPIPALISYCDAIRPAQKVRGDAVRIVVQAYDDAKRVARDDALKAGINIQSPDRREPDSFSDALYAIAKTFHTAMEPLNAAMALAEAEAFYHASVLEVAP